MVEHRSTDGTRMVVAEQAGGTTELLLELDGKRISRSVIVPMLMRIGTAVVRMDGIGGVGTEEAFRNRGYSRRVMETAVARMKAGDAALSTLFGIQDFYQKFGFETTGPEYTVCVPLTDDRGLAPSLLPGWCMRPFASGDLPAVMRLYHLNTRRATGALVRHDSGEEAAAIDRLALASPTARKIGPRAWAKLEKVAAGGADDACRVLIDSAGAIAGYAWLGAGNWWMGARREELPAAFHLAEVMARDPEAADAMLVACRHWAREAAGECDEIAMAMPPHGPVAAAASYQGGRMIATYTRGGDFMGRVLDVDLLLRQMLPEFTARVRAARQMFEGTVTFLTEEGEASFRLTQNDITIASCIEGGRMTIELPQAMLARLCLGGHDPTDVIARLPTKPAPAAMSLLGVLFPRRAPFIYPMDRF